MKKTLIALAALAVVSAASAQSTVTLAGTANIGFQKTGAGKVMLNGGADGSSSRLIFRGTEDLGGGLKANFHLESGFNIDDGTFDNTTNQLFQRQAWAGMSGGFGEVRAGRQYTLGFFGSIGDMPSTYTAPQLAVGLGFNGAGSRNSNQIQYWSPNIAGAQVRVSTQLAGDVPGGETTEIALAYAQGPLAANLSTSRTARTGSTKVGLNAAYNFGVAKVAAGYVNTDSAAGRGTYLRLSAPMGAASLFAGYAHNSTTKTNAYDVGAVYSLSKRTSLYAMFGAGNQAVTNKTAIGLVHSF